MTCKARPKRCLVTRIGLLSLLVAVLCLATIMIAQRIKTGSFARGNGFVYGRYLADPMFIGIGAGLLLLLLGGVVDALRFQRWKKATPTDEPTPG